MHRCLCLLAAAPLALVIACYNTPKPNCAFLCGAGGACPDGYTCGDDNVCHLPLSGGGLAACVPPIFDASAGRDGSTGGGADAAELDGSATCTGDLAPAADGGDAAHQALVISEIDPGSAIELYNNSAAAIDLGATQFGLRSAPQTAMLATLAPNVTIAPGGLATVDWPAGFTDVDAGGEIVLYIDVANAGDFNDGTRIGDFVCWGTNPHGSAKADAEANGKWAAAAACAAALDMGSIQRLTATDGTDAASYDTTLAPTPTTCTP